MPAMRVLEERPVAGGERFSAVIGPDPAFRRATRFLLGAALAALAWEVVRSPGGLPTAGRLSGAIALFLACLASAWLSGGAEHLVVEGGAVTFRRAGALAERSRLAPLRDLLEIRGPANRQGTAWDGLVLRTAHGTWRVGRRLSAAEAQWLATAFRRHVGGNPVPEGRPAAGTPHPAQGPEVLARLRARG